MYPKWKTKEFTSGNIGHVYGMGTIENNQFHKSWKEHTEIKTDIPHEKITVIQHIHSKQGSGAETEP